MQEPPSITFIKDPNNSTIVKHSGAAFDILNLLADSLHVTWVTTMTYQNLIFDQTIWIGLHLKFRPRPRRYTMDEITKEEYEEIGIQEALIRRLLSGVSSNWSFSIDEKI